MTEPRATEPKSYLPVHEVLPGMVLCGVAAWLLTKDRDSALRAMAASIPLKVALDALSERDSQLADRFFDVDSGLTVKFMVLGALFFATSTH